MNSSLSSNSWIGRFIGDNHRYRLDRSLGGGGMGEVFLATDTRVGKEVALKLLKDKWLASGEMRKRFEREIAVCAALQSEHIIEISDCGVTSEGFPFYAMEYLRGQTLRQLMQREKQLTPLQTANIMVQVCEGLQVAHQGAVIYGDDRNSGELIKVIHRDLKPDNIFLLPREFGEWVKILDFGIAKIHKESSEQTNLTQRFIGTFRYSSPEQIQNDKNIDGRSDIYSLGIILYEMLSALDPFGLSIDRSKVSESSWLHAHGYRPPIPLRSQPGCEHLSPQLEAVVLKCLQKKPRDRFASVGELRQALQETLQATTNTNYPQRRQIIVQPQSQQNQISSNDETVSKPLEPKLANQSRIDNSQDRSWQNPNLNQPYHNQQPNIAENRSYQQPPALNQFPAKTSDDTTPRHPASNSQQPISDGTTYQSRPNQVTPSSNPPTAQPISDGTTYQPRPNQVTPSSNPAAAQPVQPDGTTYQPRPNQVKPSSNPPAAQPVTPNKNGEQPRKSKNSKSKKKNLSTWQILAINLAIALLVIVAYHLIFRVNRTNEKQDPQTKENQNSLVTYNSH
ncbi:protein kinase domain-containing protein [Rivularia sp. UHCC 0363]|uniref:protein kinase domain-containing protein n=1 Tax=Rivularia sp. UHCC 0363 TaxID=3110244 RepID=UPI002B1F676C|nr:protein kinase [Rivularia sp. UHCC 0363]MEA5597128.1 protein kinase [Rivularia sp. UHCC 0363]